MSSTDFVDWIVYLDEDINAFHREDYFLAAIAAEVRRSYVGKPQGIRLSTFMIKFKAMVKKKKMDVKEKTKRSKAFWSTIVGLPRKKK